jgi:hypothetical protein
MLTGLPSAMAITTALEKAGRDVSRESFVDAMESLNFKPELMAGPIEFGRDRRDALRSVFVIRFDGQSQTQMPGVYSWDAKEGTQ